MKDKYDKYMNGMSYLNDNIGVFIETFVDYYGEELREEITKKFSSALYIAYQSPYEMGNTLKKYSTLITRGIIGERLKYYHSTLDISDLVRQSGNFSHLDYLPINLFRNFYHQYKLGKQGREALFKEQSLIRIRKIIPSFTEDDLEELIEVGLPIKYQNIQQLKKDMIARFADIKLVDQRYKNSFSMIEAMLKKIDPNVSFESLDSFFQNEEVWKLIVISNDLDKMLLKYQSELDKYKSYVDSASEYKTNASNIRDKYRCEIYFGKSRIAFRK